jgi:predicted dehydrogenase
MIGCGRLVERGYIPAVRRSGGVVLAAVADLEVERCVRIAPGVQAFDSIESLLSGCEVDAVIVATPPAAHLASARAAARAGLATLVEKPPAASVADARELSELDRPPWIGFNRRFLIGLCERRAAIRARAAVLELELHYQRAGWRPYTPAPDALLDTASHLVDLARWLTGGEVQRARALALTPQSGDVELDLGGVRARLGWSVDRAHRERFEARDASGAQLLRYLDGGPWRALGRRVRRPSEDNPFINSLARQLDALARELRGQGRGTLATAGDGLKVMQVLASVSSSAARLGAWEEVAA